MRSRARQTSQEKIGNTAKPWAKVSDRHQMPATSCAVCQYHVTTHTKVSAIARATEAKVLELGMIELTEGADPPPKDFE